MACQRVARMVRIGRILREKPTNRPQRRMAVSVEMAADRTGVSDDPAPKAYEALCRDSQNQRACWFGRLEETQMDAYGAVVFCDDIRFEQQGTFSLIGCYGPELRIPAEFPVTLPKLGMFVQLRIPPKYQKSTLKISIYVPGTTTDGGPAIIYELAKPQTLPEAGGATGESDSEMVMYMNHPLLYSPFNLPSAGAIIVRLFIDEKPTLLGSLNIVHVTPLTAAQATRAN